MNLEKIKNSVLTLTFFSFIISIGYIVYIEFIKDDRPKLSFDVQSVLNVLDIANKLDDLKVLYKDIDILKQNKKLSIVNVRIENKGTSSILLEDYDIEFPVGLSVNNGTILKVNILESSSEYISKKLSKITNDSKNIILPSIIIESNNYLNLSILVLHSEESEIVIEPFGKIAKVNNFLLENTYKNIEYSFWNDLTEGSISIKLARVIYYNLLMIIMLLGILIILLVPFIAYDSISGILSKFYREKKIKKYMKVMLHTPSSNDDIILDLYQMEGDNLINNLKSFYNNPNYEEIISDYNEIKKQKETEKKLTDNLELNKLSSEVIKKERNYWQINSLISKKILDNEGKINNEIKIAFNKFIEFIYKES
ncbi:hypothetical protein [Aliarcobacter cryaerophilus]|uniref:hypothetical protein n=1 Tax=Aliarcobacter cryaerophilus TaxID=28198 RepID=UPI00112F344D|nr:hypothetical protein [Aliarcobacter cryaerophilus]